MALHVLSNPNVQVNDVTIALVPNSFSYKKGQGQKSVRAQSAGGNAIEIVVAENAETKKSMVKFKLYNTEENFNLVGGWAENINGNTIRLSEGELQLSYRSMVVIDDPEYMIGADGDLEITFEGTPVL